MNQQTLHLVGCNFELLFCSLQMSLGNITLCSEQRCPRVTGDWAYSKIVLGFAEVLESQRVH